jgi:hypothetical protein
VLNGLSWSAAVVGTVSDRRDTGAREPDNCRGLGAVGPGPLRDHRPDGTPLARRAHPRGAVARATAILAAHAPLLTQFAALAVQAVSAQLDRAAALALQRSLVPSALPAVGGLEMSARYVPGTGHLGGGWYDVFCLPPGKVSAVIEDVAGAGLQAPVIMGRIRSAPRIRAGNDRSRLPARHRAAFLVLQLTPGSRRNCAPRPPDLKTGDVAERA